MSHFITRQVQVTKLQHKIPNLIHSIDTPKTEEIKIFNSSMLKLSGWVLYENKSLDVILQYNDHESVHSCKVIRNDVIALLKKDAEARCGFIIPIVHPIDFKIGFLINDAPIWVASVKIKQASKVLYGSNGHLFLDNDTNKSVEQFRGHTLISEECLSLWSKYFKRIDKYTKDRNAKYLFTLAPAKELVFPDLYPHTKSNVTPVEQFLVHLNKFNIFYPLDALREAGDISYWKLDTHWTDYGAGLVVKNIIERLQKPQKNPFPFHFQVKRLNGDLGSKLPQLTTQDILMADFSPAKNLKKFDNKIVNRGWIQIYENESAANQEKVIIFGDSFSVNMVPYLVTNFKKVIHVLSGARIDYDILEQELPDIIISEITTRFLIQPPDLNYSVSDDCFRKIDSMPESEKKDYIKNVIDSTTDNYLFFLNKTLLNFELETSE